MSNWSTQHMSANNQRAGDCISDRRTGCQIFIPGQAHETHEGNAFQASRVVEEIASDASVYTQINVADRSVSLQNGQLWTCADHLHIQFIEAPELTTGTTEIASYNRKRASTNATTLKLYSDPADVTDGTVIQEWYAGSGHLVANQFSVNFEMILKPNTTYIEKITNLDSQTESLSVGYVWYEQVG